MVKCVSGERCPYIGTGSFYVTSDRVSASVSVFSIGKMSGSLQVNKASMRSKTVEEKTLLKTAPLNINPSIYFSILYSAHLSFCRANEGYTIKKPPLHQGALPPQELYLLRNLMHFSAGTQNSNLHCSSFTLNKVPAWNTFQGTWYFQERAG